MPVNRSVPTRVGTLAVADRGAGTPVVFWPSLFSDHRLYDRVVANLGSGWRTISIDGPGFGRSDPPAGDVQPSQYADAVSDLLDELSIGSAYFAGCSWGGQIGAQFAVRRADRARGALLMNTPLEPSHGGPSALVAATRWIGSSRFFGRGVAWSMVSAATRRGHPGRVREFSSAAGSFDRVSAATTVRTVLTRSSGLIDLLPQINVPVTFLMGADDQLCPFDRLLPIAHTAPGAAVEIVPGCGHLAPLETPEAVARMLCELASQTAMSTSGWASHGQAGPAPGHQGVRRLPRGRLPLE